MTISKYVWASIFKQLHFSDFLNTILTEKSAYKGFKLYGYPVLTLKNISILKDPEDQDNVTSFDSSFCQLCNSNQQRGDEIYINYTDPWKSINLGTPCCQAVMCPNCPKINNDNVIIHYLFIKNVIYLQDEINEKEPVNFDNEISIQYNWIPLKPYDESILSNYSVVDYNYNAYTCNKILRKQDGDDIEKIREKVNSHKRADSSSENNESDSSDSSYSDSSDSIDYSIHLDFTNVCVSCVCKNCGFKCSARNYMDS